MKDQFDICDYPFADKGLHPVVLISHPDRCARAKYVNVLLCTSQRQARSRYPFEVMLNSEDGLNWESFCDCSILWTIDSNNLSNRRGRVGLERRRQIRLLLKETLRLNALE